MLLTQNHILLMFCHIYFKILSQEYVTLYEFVSSLCRSRVNVLYFVLILVYVLPK